jgi:predicted RNA-binding Zn ribbon-like protein
MKKILETTLVIREINETIIALRDAFPKVLSQRIWQHKVSMAEKLDFLKELASAKNRLWREAELAYPELKGQNYSVGTIEISYETPDVKETIN